MFKKQHVVSILDVSQFLQLLTDAVYEKERCERVHAACDRLEEFLSNAGTEVREMVAVELLGSFQNAEYPYGSDTWCLGPETKRLWAELEAIWRTSVKLDLQDRTVLEGEILMSRIVRQNLSRPHSWKLGSSSLRANRTDELGSLGMSPTSFGWAAPPCRGDTLKISNARSTHVQNFSPRT